MMITDNHYDDHYDDHDDNHYDNNYDNHYDNHYDDHDDNNYDNHYDHDDDLSSHLLYITSLLIAPFSYHLLSFLDISPIFLHSPLLISSHYFNFSVISPLFLLYFSLTFLLFSKFLYFSLFVPFDFLPAPSPLPGNKVGCK